MAIKVSHILVLKIKVMAHKKLVLKFVINVTPLKNVKCFNSTKV